MTSPQTFSVVSEGQASYNPPATCARQSPRGLPMRTWLIGAKLEPCATGTVTQDPSGSRCRFVHPPFVHWTRSSQTTASAARILEMTDQPGARLGWCIAMTTRAPLVAQDEHRVVRQH